MDWITHQWWFYVTGYFLGSYLAHHLFCHAITWLENNPDDFDLALHWITCILSWLAVLIILAGWLLLGVATALEWSLRLKLVQHAHQAVCSFHEAPLRKYARHQERKRITTEREARLAPSLPVIGQEPTGDLPVPTRVPERDGYW